MFFNDLGGESMIPGKRRTLAWGLRFFPVSSGRFPASQHPFFQGGFLYEAAF
jgi:hypothetical protein